MSDLALAAERGGVILLPTDTVYGLAAALDVPAGVSALYALKGRPRSQPCQVILLGAEQREAAISALPAAVAAVARQLVPGPLTIIVNDVGGRYRAAAGDQPGSVGLRIPDIDLELDQPLIATSANEPGGADPASVADVPAQIVAGCDLVMDVGRLPGIASAVVDLRPLEHGAAPIVLRPGADPERLLRILSEHSRLGKLDEGHHQSP